MTEQSSAGEARTGYEVAIVGMAGRFPGADDLDAFWRNLRAGVESIAFFTRDELLAEGTPAALADHPDFVPAMGALRGADELDAALFGLTPRDAEVLDPQHRLLLECAWSALEHAGHDPARGDRPVGVFAGSSASGYVRHLQASPEVVEAVGYTRIHLWNEKDHLAPGVSYRLNLRGPSLTVQTACSTSLVAVHLACQSLATGECDLALAGGVSARPPFKGGHLYTPDGIVSPDGHVRAFDADARGTVGGQGVGLVALKRLDDAIAEGDTIHAVIRGSALNNDGAQKVGYTAPSVEGQARVISEALAVAGVDAGTLQYVETHGSGTPLGDAIELKALGEVLGRAGGESPCAIGSVKTNLGHLDTAAGVAALIKTVLSLRHGEIPPSLHCAVPHAGVEALGGRLFVNTALRPWARNGAPRRAGVSSFGIGGTNAHVVLEEAPPREPSGPSRARHLLVLSAKTPTALAAAAENLAAFLEGDGAPPLADAAYTLQTGRRELEHRLAVVCADAAEGAARLRQAAARAASPVPRTERPVAFLFPGLGMHHVDMGRGLYDAEPAFREAVDAGCELLQPVLGEDLRGVLFSAGPRDAEEKGGGWDLRRLLGRRDREADASPLDETRLAQPAVFVVEYALAKLWMSWGVAPRGMLGHSLGEYVAACVAGVLRLEDALRLVALRAERIDALPPGAMLAVPLGEAALREILPPALDLAAVNTPESCVVSGALDEIERFEAALAERGTVSRRLVAGHAFHSRAMAPVAAELERLVAGFELRAPEIPFVSNVTGTWITDDEARSPAYWARHLCGTVRFADGVAALRREPDWALLEVGPGQTLGAWALQHPSADAAGGRAVFSSLRHPQNRVDDLHFLLESLGGVWAAGVPVDWAAFGADERRHRVPLPGYPFERKRYWVDAPREDRTAAAVKERGTADQGAEERGAVPIESTGKGPDVMENGLAAAAEGTARRQAVLGRLTQIAAELTGIDVGRIATDVDLFRIGFDSLLLLQGIQLIEKRLGVRLSLVEMLEEMTTLDGIARHVDAALPPDVRVQDPNAAPEPAPAPAPLAAAPALAEAPRRVPAPSAFFPPLPVEGGGTGGDVLRDVVAQQLQAMNQLMAQQLAALTGHAGHPAGAVPSAGAAPAADAVPSASAPASAPASGPARVVEPSPRARIQPAAPFVAFQPVNTEAGGLTAEQRAYLDGFTARYVERTRASKAHQVRYHEPLADSRVTARFRRAWKEILYPIVGRRAAGSRVWDLDGNEYVDIGMSFGCNLFGHGPEFVSRAIREQVELGYGLGPQSEHAGRAAELVCQLGGNDRAIFCNSGTEAVLGAIRAARTFTGRTKVVYFAGSYHGWSDIVQGRPPSADGRIRPTAPGIPALPLQDVVILDYDQPASLERLAKILDEVAVVMVEPVQSRRPDIQPHAFLHELRRMTREAGTMLHFDELITGFRIGPGGGQAFFGVDADLVTYGKIVAGGLPMGVVAGKREPMSVFDGGTWSYGDDSYPAGQRTLFAGAFFKHPLSMAVAVSILEEIQRQGTPMYDRLNARAGALVRRLNDWFEAERIPMTTANFGSAFRFFHGPEIRFPDLFNHHLIHEGIHVIPETGTGFLSTAHTDEDLDRVFAGVCAAATALRRGGLIPGPAGGPGTGGGAVRDEAAVAAASPASASATSATSAASSSSADGGAEREDGVRVLPLTEGQRQLWIESQMGEDGGRAYIESLSIRLHGALDVAALRGALQALSDRHDALRTTFAPGGETQRVHPSRPVEVRLTDLRGAAPGEVGAWVRETARRPFDLERGPLVRFGLAALGEDEHLLVFDSHHAVLDGWSVGVLIGELGELYAAGTEGRAAALRPPPDHAALLRAQGEAARDDGRAHAYWMARFADGVPVLDLPADRPRPAVRSYRGERVTRVVESALVRRLAGAGREHGLTLFHTLLSATTVWLGRLGGHDDVVVGTPSAGQAAGAGAELVGYGISFLPIRARLDPAAPFAQHARRVRRAVLEGLEHRSFSFPRLVDELLPRRDASRPPLVAASMYLDRQAEATSLGGLRAEVEGNFTGGARSDLELGMTETAGLELRLDCAFATDLFDPETVARWLGLFERLLEEVARDFATPLGALELLGAGEREQVLVAWSGATADYPRDASIHALFGEQAARAPDAAALVHGGERVTYGELDARANRLANHLRRLGVGPEHRVGLCLERGPELIVSVLAILKAGGAYVPLDPVYPRERLAFMLADAGVSVLVTDTRLAEALPHAGAARVLLDAHRDAIAAESADDPRVRVPAEGLAYLVYTSGSTGTPKAVAVPHRAVLRLARGGRWVRLDADETVLQFAPIAFDASTFEIWGTLLNGARLAIVPAGTPSLEELGQVVNGQGVTTLWLTAGLFHQVVEERPDRFPGVRQLLAGGDVLSPAHVRRVLDANPGLTLVNGYGPTENTTFTATHAVARADEVGWTVPIGRPVEGSTVYVLDDGMRPVPVGVPGELYTGGDGLARGYHVRPALTAGRFVPDPFGAPGGRLYRTGDRVRWTAAGTLEFLGRVDAQVKLRGFRIEPGEVEAALLDHPAVGEAAVVLREDVRADPRLVAYVVPRAGGEAPAPAELRERLRARLPDFMVPTAFVAMDALPLTAHGKLDRRALPAPEAPAGVEYVAPRTPAEEVLAEIWADVLQAGRVGVTDGFFDLGGQSLLAVRVVSRIREAFGVELPLRTLMEGPTVARLAEAVAALRRDGAPPPAPVARVERDEAPPLSFAQERLWFLDRLQPGSTAYNVPLRLRLAGALDAGALERALGEIVRRHDVLRTTFAEAQGEPVQVVAPFAGFRLPAHDLSHLPPAEREAEVRRLAGDDAARPFDLAAGPLFRARLLRVDEEDHVLLAAMHHAVTDGWSMGVFLRELSALYGAYRQGGESPLPELPVRYADYARWEREQLRGDRLERLLSWWKARLRGAPALLELPLDHPRPAVMTFRGAREAFHLPAEPLERLRALARAEGATLYMLLLAAFQVLLGRWAGSDDVVVGTTVAGRTRREVEGLVGLFMNTLALRTDLSGDPPFREVLRRVREATLGAFEHQDVPFERLVAELQPERSLGHSPVFQALFELRDGGADGSAGLADLRVDGMDAPGGGAKYDLALALTDTPRGLSGALTYATDLFEPATARRMMEHLGRVLQAVAADPGRRISRLALMGDAERARVAEWNRTDAEYPARHCIHHLFEAQAARTPDAVAVVFGDDAVTFRALDEGANRLANHLVQLGVGPETRVGLCLERGPELMPAILGVMKAGGAYVPMDPAHPAERLAYLLEDSGVPVVLVQERLRERLPARDGTRVIALDTLRDEIAGESAQPPAPAAGPENLAYVIYTSGSTGRPKGVAMHHRGVCNYIHWGIAAYGADRGNGSPVFSSMAVDLTITNLLPLFAGRPVHLLPEESPVEALAAVLREAPGFGLIKITPIHLGLLSTMLAPGEMRTAAHTLVIGADFLSAETTAPWQEHAPGVRLMNEYGPTETVVGCSAYVLPPGRHRAGPVPVGRAIQNLAFHVLDPHGEPVPVGLPGELYIGGAGVARGYLGRPALTAAAFVPDPFAGGGRRMYRTGDRARWTDEGGLLILGRTDHQVKVRGYRVELGEVEAALRGVPQVRECIAAVREDRPGDRRLVAYVVADARETGPGVLRAHLRARLPEYMVPDAFVVLDALPETSTGKLDRKALPAPAYPRGMTGEDEPWNYVEVQLLQLWEELLGVQGIGPADNFFDLGGNSFLALRLFNEANRVLDCDLPVATLFSGGTVRHMAEAVLEQRRSAPEAPAPVVPLQPRGSLPPVFFVHSADRNVMGYVNLLRYLPDQPAFGVRDLGELSRPVRQIAAEHVAAIREVQPHGPYYLVSWSFGGVVAYEMAVQLEAAGETVAFVGMLDTLCPVLLRRWGWDREADVVVALAEDVAARMRTPFSLEADALDGLELDEQVRRAVEALHAQGAAPPGYAEPALRAACDAVLDRIRSSAGYVPGCRSGTITLFRAQNDRAQVEEFWAAGPAEEKLTMGWLPYAPVEVHPVPGEHAVLGSEPHVRVLAQHMREALARARERCAGPATDDPRDPPGTPVVAGAVLVPAT
jgi:amino acid adenylation domain-containing protein